MSKHFIVLAALIAGAHAAVEDMDQKEDSSAPRGNPASRDPISSRPINMFVPTFIDGVCQGTGPRSWRSKRISDHRKQSASYECIAGRGLHNLFGHFQDPERQTVTISCFMLRKKARRVSFTRTLQPGAFVMPTQPQRLTLYRSDSGDEMNVLLGFNRQNVIVPLEYEIIFNGRQLTGRRVEDIFCSEHPADKRYEMFPRADPTQFNTLEELRGQVSTVQEYKYVCGAKDNYGLLYCRNGDDLLVWRAEGRISFD